MRILYGRPQQQVCSRSPTTSKLSQRRQRMQSFTLTMHRFLTALAACIAAAQAFKGTSPFLFFSTAQYVPSFPPNPISSGCMAPRRASNISRLPPALQDATVAQIQTSRAVLDTTKEFLGSCPTDIYYIIHQPSVLPTDLTPSSIPNLQAALSSSTVKAKYLVSETRGLESDVKQELATHLRNACGEIKLLDQDLTIGTAEALSSQISGALKDGKKVLVHRTMEKLSGSRMSPQRAATLNEIGNALPSSSVVADANQMK